MKRRHMKPKREKWAKHHVHCACGDALREVLAALSECKKRLEFCARTSGTDPEMAHIAVSKYEAILAKYGSPSCSTVPEKGGAPNTESSLNPEANKGRRGNRKPKHTTSGTTNLAGPKVSEALAVLEKCGATKVSVSHAWLDNRCARCGHEHEGPCPFCECAEHVEPVDPYDAEVERALEAAARNPSL